MVDIQNQQTEKTRVIQDELNSRSAHCYRETKPFTRQLSSSSWNSGAAIPPPPRGGGVRGVVPLGDQIVDLLVLRLQLLVLAGDERLLRGNQTLQVGQRRTLLGYGLFETRNLPPDDAS